MIEVKNTGKPDERRDFPHGHLDVLDLTGLTFGVTSFDPGWRWSESIGPLTDTESCQTHHNGYVLQGRLHIRMDNGEEAEVTPGDVFVIPPGHDAWVVGDEQFTAFDFAGGMTEYARAKQGG